MQQVQGRDQEPDTKHVQEEVVAKPESDDPRKCVFREMRKDQKQSVIGGSGPPGFGAGPSGWGAGGSGDKQGESDDSDDIDSSNTPDMQIFVKKPDGQNITLDVNASDSIIGVKGQLQMALQVRIRYQRLVFADDILENTRSLCDYNIKDQATIKLMIKGSGGGKRGRAPDDAIVAAPLVIFVPTVESNDTDEAKACITNGNLTMEDFVAGMDLSTLENFYTTILENPKTGNMTSFTKPYLPFVKVISDLQDITYFV